MGSFSRLQVANTMIESGLVPLFYHKDTQLCKDVLKACYEGGARVFEFTNRGDFAHETFAELSKFAAKELPGMIMGVGSVVDAGTCSLYIQLGANFIVSPLLNPEMAKTCNRRKVLWSPGCGSVSEISQAEELGCEIVKIFPGSQVGGPKFIAAVKGPMPWSCLMPSGGVEPEKSNLKAWFDAGASCVGMGSQLITKEILATKDFAALAAKVSETLAMIREIQKK
jgi:2-dehydro-3-deoxyphosphogluconate aldolase / (4S)-4-hydroxy-2-oxoglutarate aldolase